MEKYQQALDNIGTLKASFDKAAKDARGAWFSDNGADATLYEGLSQKMDTASAFLKAGDVKQAEAALDATETSLDKKQGEHIAAYHDSWYGKGKKDIQRVSGYRTEILRIKGKIASPE